jgi:endonuclease III
VASPSARTRTILKRLKRRYPRGKAPPSTGLTDHLSAVIIARHTEDGRAYRACAKLMSEFVDWNEVRVARWGEVERAVRPVLGERGAGEAARRLVYCLQQIFLQRGDVHLDGLAKASPAEARKFLLALDFLDRDEVNLVLLLGLNEQVMPVDSDVLRAGKRLGVISNSATKLQAQKALEQSLDGEDLHACYLALREHARRFCFPDSPECANCPVRKSCRQRKVH